MSVGDQFTPVQVLNIQIIHPSIYLALFGLFGLTRRRSSRSTTTTPDVNLDENLQDYDLEYLLYAGGR